MNKVALFCLCIFVAYMPFEGLGYFEDLPSGAKLLGGLVVGSAALAFLSGCRIRMLSLPVVVRTVLVVYSALSLLWSVSAEDTLFYIPRVTQILILVLLIWEFAATYQDQIWPLRSLLVGMLVPLAMAFASFRGSSRFAAEEGARYTGGGLDMNYLAYMCSAAILIAVYLATNPLPWDRFCRWFYWGMAVLCAITTVLTGSRGGFGCMLAAGLFSMVLAGVSRRRILTVLQVLAAVACVYFLARYIVPAALLNRVVWDEPIAEDPRWGIWQRGLAVFWQHPLLGVGAGTYATATAVLGQRTMTAHNTFISILVELGTVGLALYLWYTIMLFRAAWRLPRREKLLWLGVLAIWFVNANSAGSQIDHFSWFLQIMVLVQAAACPKTRPAKKLPPYQVRVVPVAR